MCIYHLFLFQHVDSSDNFIFVFTFFFRMLWVSLCLYQCLDILWQVGVFLSVPPPPPPIPPPTPMEETLDKN